MSNTTHAAEFPSVEEIDARIAACHEELEALRLMRRAAAHLMAANQVREQRQPAKAGQGVAHAG
jgi:hypothetical protein